MSVIYLVRHGQASFGAANYDKLSELGCTQAKVLGQYFADSNIQFDAAYAGDLQRQQKTAQLALSYQPNSVELVTDNRLNEMDNNEQIEKLLPLLTEQNEKIKTLVDEGFKQSKNFQKIIEAVFNLWISEQCPEVGIESWASYSSKVQAVIQSIMQQQISGKTVAIFTSGGTIATIVSHVLGLTGAQTYQFYEPVINCSITQILYSSTKCSLSNFNDYSYLQGQSSEKVNLVTYR